MKIALLGYGIEGRSAYEYFSTKHPDAQFVIYDSRNQTKSSLPLSVEFIGGVVDFHNTDADLVIKTPAIAPSLVSSRGTVSSVTKEFFNYSPAPIIGVTGTKGKGTTASLIAEILKQAGKKTWLVGNIGTPALDVLDQIKPNDYVVYELSSFQLWDIKKSPHISVVLMIEPEHMDVHSDLTDYISAKSNIARYQGVDDITVYHPKNKNSAMVADASPGKKIKYMTKKSAHVQGDELVIDGRVICKTREVGLVGRHNLENICAAITAAWQITNDVEAICEAVTKFKGLPHRLQHIATKGGVSYYDDSFSTAGASTLAALKAFDNQTVMIIGGYDRGYDLGELARELIVAKNLKHVLLIGQTGEKLADLLEANDFRNYEVSKSRDMTEIVATSSSLASEGDNVILSPGFASFDMFKDFVDRGERFIQAVEALDA